MHQRVTQFPKNPGLVGFSSLSKWFYRFFTPALLICHTPRITVA